MGSNSLAEYVHLLNQLKSYSNIPQDLISSFRHYILLIYGSDQENKFSEPMLWIGIYIALASLICVFAMIADLLHGFRSRKLWFPCKYFTLNAASLSVIAVAMKLPVDLNNSMPGHVDQAAKLGSMAFMCTMMTNLLPSLATMNSKELFTNIIALAILKSKQILELKYQAGHQTALRDLQPERLTFENLKQHVSNYWIMARTGSPQFISACHATSSASGVICAASTFIHIRIVYMILCLSTRDYKSDYKWSMLVIFVIQSIGVILGTIAPLFRCFACLSFKLTKSWIWNHINVFKVEKYWTQKLSDWKQNSISFSSRSRKYKIVIHNLKIIVLRFCIGIQKTVVVACKVLGLFYLLFVICGMQCFHCWRSLKAMLVASGILVIQNPQQPEQNIDLRRYVLQLQDDMELADKTLKNITKSVNLVIVNAENHQPNNLMTLLVQSNGFAGVGEYDSFHVPPLTAVRYLNCWSLPLVTLTTIAISLPEIQNDRVDNLLISVSEGLAYVKLVEGSLNTTNDYVRIQKAAKMLWLEVEFYNRWLGKKLQYHAPGVNRAPQILQWFRDEAQNMVMEVEAMDIDGSNERAICANSMYRITQTILLLNQGNIDEVSQEDLFTRLSSMISDILAACLTNLPLVIAMKCHESVIEKREASVLAAAQLLGQTREIINTLNAREIPNLNTEELAFIENWRRAYLMHPFPPNP
ncbi:hypothetical protein CTI12_AA298070 [Artemisia annua]|uniref:Uncharacterized protein n=1 Tax=Artemisia annua TaxID=35608 RepID=A0A2U1N6V5_ARTAN|nr:hypothetical protein CTI12_AA298070 [Artemisia annua]